MCVGSLAGVTMVTYLRYTAPTSPKKGETAVRCCDPALSVHVMLVSRNVFHVVSALKFILFLILRQRPPKPYKLLIFFMISVIVFKMGKHSDFQLSFFRIEVA